MPNDITPRNYPLPHPDNIAVQDVSRIRAAIENIDTDNTLQQEWLQNVNAHMATIQLETLLWEKK